MTCIIEKKVAVDGPEVNEGEHGLARGTHMEPRRYGSIGVWMGCIATTNFLIGVRRIDSLHLIGPYTGTYIWV